MKIVKILFLILFIIFFTNCQDKKINVVENNNTITILTPNFDDKITGPIKKEKNYFEEKTNSDIRIVSPSWDEMVGKINDSLVDNKINYDIYVLFSSWAGSILSENNALEITEEIKKEIQWDDILPIYKNNVLKWNKKYFFFPYDGDAINLYYRKDLFENKEYKEKFEKEFGYKLDVPKTWSEYKDIAKFFNGWDWDNDGQIEYGFAESRTKGYGTIFQFFTRAAAYTKLPDNKEFYFDKNMKPLINTQGFKKALDEFISVMDYAPPNIINFSPAEVRQSFIGGEVAMVLDWADVGAMAQNAKESQIKNRVGYAALPGSNKVFDIQKNRWINTYNAPSSICGNWVFVINKNSKNKKLAIEFASYMSSKKITNKYVPVGSSGINPSRYSHLNPDNYEEWIKDGFSEENAKNYLNAINKSLSNKNVLSDLRIRGSNLYYETFDTFLNRALKKDLSVEDALNLTAKQWDNITYKLGLEKQIKLYRESINE